jgi:hypothetical protein
LGIIALKEAFYAPIQSSMNAMVPIEIIAFIGGILGLFFALYAIATRRQRLVMRVIRDGAASRGWQFRKRRWTGDPTSFIIDGPTAEGWTLKTIAGETQRAGFSVTLRIRFPRLAGAMDVAILPRGQNDGNIVAAAQQMPEATRARIAAISGELTNVVDFTRVAREVPSSLPAFDSLYKVLALPRAGQSFVDIATAERLLNWPSDGVHPRNLFVWRDPLGFHFQGTFPGPPEWPEVSHLVHTAAHLSERLPPPSSSPNPAGLVDDLIGRFLG